MGWAENSRKGEEAPASPQTCEKGELCVQAPAERVSGKKGRAGASTHPLPARRPPPAPGAPVGEEWRERKGMGLCEGPGSTDRGARNGALRERTPTAHDTETLSRSRVLALHDKWCMHAKAKREKKYSHHKQKRGEPGEKGRSGARERKTDREGWRPLGRVWERSLTFKHREKQNETKQTTT